MARVTRGAITNAKNPSLWSRNAYLWCAATSRTDNGFYLWKSADFGRNWTQVTMATIWDGALYYRASATGLIGGGAASIAGQRGTSPLAIDFKKTSDESDWSGAVVYPVGTYSGSVKQFAIRQKQENGRAEIIVTNGVDAAWISKDLGRTWDSY